MGMSLASFGPIRKQKLYKGTVLLFDSELGFGIRGRELGFKPWSGSPETLTGGRMENSSDPVVRACGCGR
jgi:hypothetical protein